LKPDRNVVQDSLLRIANAYATFLGDRYSRQEEMTRSQEQPPSVPDMATTIFALPANAEKSIGSRQSYASKTGQLEIAVAPAN
jgi:hypothetical protein